jgi:hypothetical protein
MTLQQLKYIVAIDRYRSFAKAADALGISQPTLSAIIPQMHLPFLTDAQRENVRRIEGDYLSQRRVSLYIREDYIRQAMLNTITKTLLRFMPAGMMEERIAKYGVKL